MNFKLDENLGSRGKDFLIKAGHQVETVHDEGLNTASDLTIINTCKSEGLCLVTLDVDFGNPLRFNPADYRGIAVVRLPAKFTFSDLMIAISTLARAVETESIDGKLWIVERGRIRIYRPE